MPWINGRWRPEGWQTGGFDKGPVSGGFPGLLGDFGITEERGRGSKAGDLSAPNPWQQPIYGQGPQMQPTLGPTQWAGPNAIYPNWGDDPSSGYANDVALINAGPWPGGDGGGWGGPWTGGGGGFGPGLMWDVQDGPGSGMWNEPEGGYDEYVEPVVEEEAAPFNWGSVGAGRLAKAKEYAALGQMGKAKNVFTSGDKGGAWSPEIHQQLRTFKTGG